MAKTKALAKTHDGKTFVFDVERWEILEVNSNVFEYLGYLAEPWWLEQFESDQTDVDVNDLLQWIRG